MKLKITEKKGAIIPKEFIGLFIEDINYAIDGGLYAELLENRNFESMDAYGKENDYYAVQDGLYGWSTCPEESRVTLTVVQGSPVSAKNPHYLRVTTKEAGCGFANRAYDGIYMRSDVAYRVSFYARKAGYEGKIYVTIIKDGKQVVTKELVLAEADASGWNQWKKYEFQFKAEEEVAGARFAVLLENAGTVEFDFFSMMPEDAVCGVFRKDLAEILKDLQPGFLRFPGGCVVEGNTLSNRYQYKNTLGRLEERPYNWNRWAVHGNNAENDYHGIYSHYGQTYGIGFYEYFLLCEYLGTKPLPVLGVGLACQYQSHERVEPDDPAIWSFIQDYLDLIEFANGGTDTKWGALRARMGHEEPFGLEMIGVGNEQWENEESRFFERYTLFEREIHKVYPDIKLIGTAGPELDSPRFRAAWEYYHDNEEKENFVYAVDEHYYTKPEWFLSHLDYFDKVSRKTKIFFGEYAAHPTGWLPMNRPDGNRLDGALAEAAFLTGMARNSDVVIMTCYAPLLARLGYAQWNPDLIWFDAKSAYRTPNYFVQQLFSRHAGDYNILFETQELPCQVSYDEASKELIVKLVNITGEAKEVSLTLDAAWKCRKEAVTEILLTGKEAASVNTIEEESVVPQVKQISLDSGSYTAAPLSLTILRIPAWME